MTYLIIFLALLFLPGIYFTWQLRNDRKFEIRQVQDHVELWYCHRTEWIFDSVHATKEAAIEQIHKFGKS